MNSLTNKKVLVTGGAGFIGSHLVDRIIQENPSDIHVVDNFFLGEEENLEDAHKMRPDLEVFRLDASDLAAMRDLVEEKAIEVVFNLAVIPLPTSLKYPVWTVNVNIGLALTFCELARTNSIETLIHSSSSEAYGSAKTIPMNEDHPMNPKTPYAASKLAGDELVLSYIRTFGIDAAVVRPFNNYGPRQNPGRYAGIIPIVVKKLKKNEPIEIFGDGEQTRDYIFVKETADAFVKVYQNNASRGKVLNIATGKEITINDLVAKLLEILGKQDHPVFHSEDRIGDVRRHCGGVDLAKDLIGFQPHVMPEQGLLETALWYQERL
ncbi:MAG: NAD-dependent epimerase/dehydratase family protein [Pelolinea sp.]|nr:NAD-dependent epimerase/dehydratase family protein [Pelolinea sp.]